jgi:Flp pilus assembly protein TadG
MRFRRHDRSSRRAVAATELAIMLPVLVVPLVASVDYARLFYAYNTITNCARNGAAWASNPYTNGTISPTQSPYTTVTQAATADAGNLSPTPTVAALTYSSTVSGTYSSTYLSSGYVKVTVHWNVSTLFHYPGMPTQLSRTVIMRMLPRAS